MHTLRGITWKEEQLAGSLSRLELFRQSRDDVLVLLSDRHLPGEVGDGWAGTDGKMTGNESETMQHMLLLAWVVECKMGNGKLACLAFNGVLVAARAEWHRRSHAIIVSKVLGLYSRSELKTFIYKRYRE
jgi:hypothetical protein